MRSSWLILNFIRAWATVEWHKSRQYASWRRGRDIVSLWGKIVYFWWASAMTTWLFSLSPLSSAISIVGEAPCLVVTRRSTALLTDTNYNSETYNRSVNLSLPPPSHLRPRFGSNGHRIHRNQIAAQCDSDGVKMTQVICTPLEMHPTENNLDKINYEVIHVESSRKKCRSSS